MFTTHIQSGTDLSTSKDNGPTGTDILNPSYNYYDPLSLLSLTSVRIVYSPKMLTSKPAVSTHPRYHVGALDFHQLYLRGLCHSAPENNFLHMNCSEYMTHSKFFNEMHIFEEADYTRKSNQSEMIALQRARQDRFKGCDLTYSQPEFQKVFSGQFNVSIREYEAMLIKKMV